MTGHEQRASAAGDRAAIVLAGGRGSRLGGASKALLQIDGRPALARVVDALLRAGRGVVVVVGPADDVAEALGGEALEGRVRVAIERDRFGGPAVAVAAGVAELVAAGVPGDALVDLVACDLVHPRELVAALDAATSSAVLAHPEADGVMLVDEHGREQWLASCIRLAALTRALADVTGGAPLRRHLNALTLVRTAEPGRATRDIDTPSDLAAYGAHMPASTARPGTADTSTMEDT